MKSHRLREAIRFHGHLGPWLVIGLKMGERALRELGAKKYFGLSVKAWGVTRRPKSCLIDGLQLSCGATYGKGNIQKLDGSVVRVVFHDNSNDRRVVYRLTGELICELGRTRGHRANERLARKLFSTASTKIFSAHKE